MSLFLSHFLVAYLQIFVHFFWDVGIPWFCSPPQPGKASHPQQRWSTSWPLGSLRSCSGLLCQRTTPLLLGVLAWQTSSKRWWRIQKQVDIRFQTRSLPSDPSAKVGARFLMVSDGTSHLGSQMDHSTKRHMRTWGQAPRFGAFVCHRWTFEERLGIPQMAVLMGNSPE